MIAERSSGVQVQSTITGDSYQAGIDDENMAHIIGLFTDLYSDQIRAVIREYSTNALDAQIEAGVDRPIEITLPTPLAPFFKVKDRGCGLDAEDIRKIYSRYGTSTKRATNDQNGMLGLGCKSALTYTHQFTVESVKGGKRTVCSISREADGVPVFTVIASLDAPGEENGTEVVVPTQRHHHDEFARKAADVYSYFTPGTVLVNGEAPKVIEGLKLNDEITIVKVERSYDRKPTQVVMGNVSYPVHEEYLDLGLPRAHYAVVRVPIGAVNFSPDREKLMYTKTTRDTLTRIKEQVSTAIQAAVQKEIEKAATPRGAIQAMIQWRDLLGKGVTPSFRFKGRDMPETIEGSYILVSATSRKLSQHDKAPRGFLVEYAANAVFVTGYAPSQFTAQHKRKLVQYAEDNNLSPSYFMLTADAAIHSPWVESSQVTSWEAVKAVKLTAESSNMGWRSGRPTGSYDAFIGGVDQHIQADEIDQDESIYYCRGLNKHAARDYAWIIGKYEGAATVVCIPENRFAKFMRNFPDAESYRTGIQRAYDTWTEALTPEVREALMIRDKGNTGWYRRLDASRIHDPRLAQAIQVHDTVDVQAAVLARDQFKRVMHAVNPAGEGVEWTCPTEQYTLLEDMRGYVTDDHMYLYLNAAYGSLETA